MANATALFDSSLKEIRNTLSDKHRNSFRTFSSHQDMVAELRLKYLEYSDKSRLAACCRKIANFANSFAPYFDIINIFVQINPEWAGWFWGSLSLVFQLGCNLVTNLENLAEMFDKIAFTLPRYQRWFDICRKNTDSRDEDRLVQSLAFIYADIIEFALQAYRMFSRLKRTGKWISRASAAGDLLWKPFQTRFSRLLNRLQEHEAWFETEAMINQHDLITEHYLKFVDYIKLVESQSDLEKSKELAAQASFYDRLYKSVREWISGPSYRGIYEHTKRARLPGSGEWLLRHVRYVSWRDAGFPIDRSGDTVALQKDWMQRTLFIQAKPGYGKTFLSCIVIDDVITRLDELVPNEMEPAAVGFVHFTDSDRWECRRVNEALKSLASQLLTQHKSNRLTLDALDVLVKQTSSGQQQASMDDITMALKLLLRQHPTFLIVDAIDECDEPQRMLRLLRELARSSDCCLLVSSRPTIEIPVSFDLNDWDNLNDCVFSLNRSLNHVDIQTFLHKHLQIMINRGLFSPGQDINVAKVSEQLALEANGMFLWAQVLVNYLSCTAMSPSERLSTLNNPSSLEGIDNLYDRILSLLRSSSNIEQNVAHKIFCCLSGSLYPVSNQAMHTAIAITPGRSTTESDHLTNFPGCVPQITCALVEISESGNLAYIHLSFKEYLETKSKFFSATTADEYLATICLSYLVYDIPPKPLQPLQVPGGPICGFFEESSANTLEANATTQAQLTQPPASQQLTKMYPFLRYSALCWYSHLRLARKRGYEKAPREMGSWISNLVRFLIDRNAVTAWVEACCIFQLVPSLDRLPSELKYLRSHGTLHTIDGRELLWLLTSLHQLAAALNNLRVSHASSLKRNPSLIWQKEITTATDSHFWPIWGEETPSIQTRELDDEATSGARYFFGSATSVVSRTSDYPNPFI